jgi:hypothetical protein
MTFEEIPLPEWPPGGAGTGPTRAAVDRWVRSDAMSALVRAFDGTPPHGSPAEALAQLTAFSEVWDYRRGGLLERIDVVDVDYSDGIDELVHEAARALGLAGRARPSTDRYDHLLILGAGTRTALARCDFAARLLRTGVEAGRVTAISSLRPLWPSEVESAVAERMPDPRVEADVMGEALVRAFGIDGVPERRTGVSPGGEPWRVDTYGPLTVLAAPGTVPGRRATTHDGFMAFAALVDEPAATDRILNVTTDLYGPFQHAAAVLRLGMPYRCGVETVGLDILEYGRWLEPSSPTAILQELRAAILGFDAVFTYA